MRCSLCGAQVLKSATRCSKCGTRVPGPFDTLRAPLATRGRTPGSSGAGQDAKVKKREAWVPEPARRVPATPPADRNIERLEGLPFLEPLEAPASGRPAYVRALLVSLGFVAILIVVVSVSFVALSSRKPAVIDEPPQEAATLSTPEAAPAPPAPQVERKETPEELAGHVNELAGQLGDLSENAVWQQVADLRKRIDGLAVPSAKEPLSRQVDAIVVAKLDIQAQNRIERARGLYNQGDFGRTLQQCQAIMDFYDRREIPELVSEESQGSLLLAEARDMAAAAARLSDPSQRYAVRGFALFGEEVFATLFDTATGDSLRVKKGDRVAEFSVEGVDARLRTVTLRRRNETTTLYR